MYFLAKYLLESNTKAPQIVSLESGVTPVGAPPQIAFQVLTHGPKLQVFPYRKLKINGTPIQQAQLISVGDRIEWDEGFALVLDPLLSLELTRAVAARKKTLDESGGTSLAPLEGVDLIARVVTILNSEDSDSPVLRETEAWNEILKTCLHVTGAETASILGQASANDGGGWDLIASYSQTGSQTGSQTRSQPAVPATSGADVPTLGDRARLFSLTILQEALATRSPVCVESLIGHPLQKHESIVASRLFSVACIPLQVGGNVAGALFLSTRTPGRSVRQTALAELSRTVGIANLLIRSTFLKSPADVICTRGTRGLKGTEPPNGTYAIVNDRSQGRSHTQAQNPSLTYGAHSPLTTLVKKAERLARSDLSLILQGETGTGKELVARLIHDSSDRRHGPFVAVNCAAIPETLLEAYLFGFEKGAFTGAFRPQIGKMLAAGGGTLFLDEIGDLKLDLQSKLLRAIQERKVEPIGASHAVEIDVRIVCASHADLQAAVDSGKFRADLFFRLNGATLKIPPLRERGGDIALLATHFLKEIASDLSLDIEAVQALERYRWPGNIRELKQVIERTALLTDNPVIEARDLELGGEAGSKSASEGSQTSAGPGSSTDGSGHGTQGTQGVQANWNTDFTAENMTLLEAKNRFVQLLARKALQRSQGNRAAAAMTLGVSERTLYRILEGAAGGEL